VSASASRPGARAPHQAPAGLDHTASPPRARFTPGPWCWEQCGEKEDAPVVGIAFLHSDTDCKNPLSGFLRDYENGDEIQYYRETIAYEIQSNDGCSASANAALIAAAPELYEALEKAAPFIGWASTRHQIIAGVDAAELYDLIDALLAKARGEHD
jgi:ribosomal protein S12 methylthiotransferase accessory factor YcaO